MSPGGAGLDEVEWLHPSDLGVDMLLAFKFGLLYSHMLFACHCCVYKIHQFNVQRSWFIYLEIAWNISKGINKKEHYSLV